MAKSDTRFFVLADTHDLSLTTDQTKSFRYPLAAGIDVVLHCGDLTDNGGLKHHKEALNLIGSMDAELKLVVPGNHEIDLDQTYMQASGLDITQREQALDLWKGDEAKRMGVCLLDEGLHQFTLKSGASFTVYASPYTPKFGESAFQYNTNNDRYNPTECTPRHAINTSTDVSRVPDFPNVDIMMTHGPPQYILDSNGGHSSSSGCEHLRRAVIRARPLLHCFGHIHGSWGHRRVIWKSQMIKEEREEYPLEESHTGDDAYLLPPEFIGANSCRKQGFAKVKAAVEVSRKGKDTVFVNAAIGNEDGSPVNAPWVVEVSLPIVGARGTKRKSQEEDGQPRLPVHARNKRGRT
ncbi:MAG: hypothetical protein M1831_006304 [Alyxoria varia]|nr:MAG: hypothetical protein M1831_006304 [Alyxoria varia]